MNHILSIVTTSIKDSNNMISILSIGIATVLFLAVLNLYKVQKLKVKLKALKVK